jgi:hypothetical protein
MNEEELLVAAGLADYPGCSDVYESISYESTAATMEFTADGQVISSGQLATIIVLNMTDACLSDLSGQAASVDAAACAELEAGYNSDSSTTGTCVLSPGNCQCTVKAAAQDLSSADNYVLSGNQLVDTTGATIDYCVEGSTLRLGDELTTMVLSRVD